MANLKIKNAPLIPNDQLESSIKIPTGGKGNYSVNLGQIAQFTKNSLSLAVQADVDRLFNEKADKSDTYTKLEVDERISLGQGGVYGFKTYTDFLLVKDNIPANSIVTILEEGQYQGDNVWDGQVLTPSPYDPLAQAKEYTDTKLLDKADKNSVYLKSETFNQQEVQDLVSSSQTSINNRIDTEIIQNGAALPFNETVNYADGAIVVKDGNLQQLIGGAWVRYIPEDVVTSIGGEVGDVSTEAIGNLLDTRGYDAQFVKDASGNTQQDINNIINMYVSPKMFGAVGDGVSDDTQALRDCFNFMLANEAIFYDYAESVYNFTENISIIAPNKKITIKGNCKFKSETSYITFSGAISLIGNIVSSTTKNSKVISISSSVGLVENNIIAIQNTRPFSFNQYRSYYYDGEIKEVLSVSSDSVTLKSGTETSYQGGIEDKVYKITPVVLNISGVTFDCNGFAGVRIQLAAHSKFDFKAYNKLNLTNASYGIVFDRVYQSRMTGGEAVKLGLGNSGTDYGIAASNCQDLYINAEYVYGHRHAGAMGGGEVLGAIPNRRVYFENSKLENANTVGIHCADIHGNSINCHYKKCVIQGLVGLGGEQCYSIENTITVNADETRTPIFMTEVSGECGSIRDMFLDCGGANNLCGWASSITGRMNTKPYSFLVVDAKIGKNTFVGIMASVTVGVNDSRFIIDGFDFLNGVPPTLTRLLTYAESASDGVTAVKPSFIQITGNKNMIPDTVLTIAADSLLPNVTKRVMEQSGATSNGSWIKYSDGSMICRHRMSATVTFNTAYQGGFKSEDLAWTYPKPFIGVPTIMAIALDNASQAVKAKPPTSTAVNVFGFSSVSYATAGVAIDLVAIGRHLS